MNKLYKTVITFEAADHQAARIINTAVALAAVRHIPGTRSVRMAHVGHTRAVIGWLAAGALLIGAYGLYCIATGFWR